MDDFSLPLELQRLERQLVARERPQPSHQAKQRWLCSVRAELRPLQARGRWAFAIAMAATVLVWLNLSLCATQATDCGLGLGGSHEPLEGGAQQIHQLLPDLSPREVMRQAVLVRAGSTVVPCPRLPAGHLALRSNDVRIQRIDD
jgi:hypothetical protein